MNNHILIIRRDQHDAADYGRNARHGQRDQFSFRTELERIKPGMYCQVPVEVTVRIDFEGLPVSRVVVSEDAEFYLDDMSGRGTGKFAAYAGDELYVSGSRINKLQGDEEETLRGLTESELEAYQQQRQAALDETWFEQYAPRYEFDQRHHLGRAA